MKQHLKEASITDEIKVLNPLPSGIVRAVLYYRNIHTIRRISILAGIKNKSVVAHIFRALEHNYYQEGEVVYYEGDLVKGVLVVVEGKLELFNRKKFLEKDRKDILIRFGKAQRSFAREGTLSSKTNHVSRSDVICKGHVGPGELTGHTCFDDPQSSYLYSARAESPTVAYLLPRSAIDHISGEIPEIFLIMRQQVNAVLHASDRKAAFKRKTSSFGESLQSTRGGANDRESESGGVNGVHDDGGWINAGGAGLDHDQPLKEFGNESNEFDELMMDVTSRFIHIDRRSTTMMLIPPTLSSKHEQGSGTLVKRRSYRKRSASCPDLRSTAASGTSSAFILAKKSLRRCVSCRKSLSRDDGHLCSTTPEGTSGREGNIKLALFRI